MDLEVTLKKYRGLDTLPLWNFLKINETGDLKYLYKADRDDYYDITVNEDLKGIWEGIQDEYSRHDRPTQNALSIQNDIHWRYNEYLTETTMLKYLMHVTTGENKVEYIKELRKRGYRLRNTSHEDYQNDVMAGFQRVKNHINQMDRLKHQLPEAKTEKDNPFHIIIVWLSSNLGYDVKESLSVRAYLEYSKTVKAKINARANKKG